MEYFTKKERAWQYSKLDVSVTNNTADFDFTAERGGVKYAISVKTRNKYESSGVLNSRYKLTDDPTKILKEAKLRYKGVAAWVAISLEIDKGVFSAYFGKLSDLSGNQKGINMSENAVKNYEQLASLKKFEELGLTKKDYSELKNVYKKS